MTAFVQERRHVRGHLSTPTSFVDRVVVHLDGIAAEVGRLASRLDEHSARRAAGINRLAAHISTRDPRDPRLYALLKAHEALRDPVAPDWRPGLEMKRVISGCAEVDPDDALSELVGAAAEDVVSALGARVQSLETENATLRLRVEKLNPYRFQVAQDDVIRLRGEMMVSPRWKVGAVAQELAAAESELAMAETTNGSHADADDTPGDFPEAPGPDLAAIAREARQETPTTGVRRRGAKWQAFWRDENGKQQQQGGFVTVEEAVRHREAKLAQVRERKAG